MFGNVNLPMAIGLAVVVMVLYFVYQRKKTSASTDGLRPLKVFVFTRARGLLSLTASSAHGMADLSKHGFGSFVERPECVLSLRSGRPWVVPQSEPHSASLRNREQIMFVRAGDPAPLDMAVGRAGMYHGVPATVDDLRRLKGVAERSVSMAVAAKGDSQGREATALGWCVCMSLALAGAMWISVLVLGYMKGGA